MATRVTQQFIQYVADPSTASDVRLTRSFAQVLISQSGTTIENVAQTMLSDSVQQIDFVDSVSNTFFDGATDNEWTYDPVFNVTVNQALLSQTAVALYFNIFQGLFDTGAGNVGNPDPQPITVIQYLNFTERRFEQVANWLKINQGQPLTIAELAVANNFLFTNSISSDVTIAYNAVNDLSFTQTVARFVDENADNNFSFEQIVLTTSPFERSPSQGILRQSVGISIDDAACREKEYAPLVGTKADDEFGDMPLTVPTITPTTTGITLKYPPTTPTLTLSLNIPDFGNADQQNFMLVQRETRGGDLKVFTDPDWGKWERLEFNISGNTEECNASFEDVVTFLNTSLGENIRLTDWESRDWDGFIVTADTEIENQVTGFRLRLVFEGALV